LDNDKICHYTYANKTTKAEDTRKF
jgi:hypothetical protein